MKILLDANIFLAVILNEPEKERIIELTRGAEMVSPEVVPYEIGNALLAMLKRRRLTKEQVVKSFNTFDFIPKNLVQINVAKAIEIACMFDIYAYDAYYLEVANRLRLPLLTLDKRMQNNAQELNINILEV
ncbi:twitching motility protein PilT [Bacteroidia bacterium]|nr:twitching motility protein PilT [Bacteroidia bacterium]